MATATSTKRGATKPTAAESIVGMIASFLEGIDELNRSTLTSYVEKFETLYPNLRADYDVRNQAHRADQVKRNVTTVRDLGWSPYVDQLKGQHGTDAVRIKPEMVAKIMLFGAFHTMDTEQRYNEECADEGKVGTWTGYLALLGDVRDEFRNADGSLTEAGKARKERKGKAINADDYIDLGTGDWVQGIPQAEGYNLAVEALKRLHDFNWQVQEYLSNMTDKDAADARKALKDAIKRAKG